ncbi:MAG: tRNA threonylcarbamoyladenosine biosynthesis protein RimN [Methylothermaceae bacteria B42]|nr:MAG: tRNA threonylcarbamoyladenosine biosynthesis protein RimN [Methylothermaceae bacteria B42]HHJ39383.1 tRNA threonylcarbamoyladenosine biosynthesis protein RimN [Methylothermaceae bacterium]
MSLTPGKLRRAASHLRHGGIAAYPTEAIYGLGCDPWNPDAVYSLLELKQRPVTKGLILIASTFEQLLPFIILPPQPVLERILASWPGPVTWVLPVSPSVPLWLRGEHQTIAARVTAHPIASALCNAFDGALVSTSANPAGRRPARTSIHVRRYFRHANELFIIHGRVGKLARPTPIYDALSGRCLRQ